MGKGKRKNTSKPDPESRKSKQEVYMVERIVQRRVHKGVVQYLLKWKGYPSQQNTWEPVDNVFCQDMIHEFEEQRRRKILAKVIAARNPPSTSSIRGNSLESSDGRSTLTPSDADSVRSVLGSSTDGSGQRRSGRMPKKRRRLDEEMDEQPKIVTEYPPYTLDEVVTEIAKRNPISQQAKRENERRELQRAIAPDGQSGFDEGRKPLSIVGYTSLLNEPMFAVRFEGADSVELVSLARLKRDCPDDSGRLISTFRERLSKAKMYNVD